VEQARKVLSSMARRVMQNKIIMAGIILFLLAGIGIILYVKLKK
jgi:vesicle transport through interaction with t-SNAREs protein 1